MLHRRRTAAIAYTPAGLTGVAAVIFISSAPRSMRMRIPVGEGVRPQTAVRPRGRDRSAAARGRAGVNHIDTADAYGPYITSEIIREALFPYGDHVHIVIRVGVVRDERGGWLPANSPESLRAQVHDNLRPLGLDVLDVINLRTAVRNRRKPS
jgi:pyridoxine 4-dehydrogenase